MIQYAPVCKSAFLKPFYMNKEDQEKTVVFPSAW